MRASTYEIVLPLIGEDEREVEGKRVLINGLYGSVDVVDEDVAARLFGDDPDELDVPVKERLALRGHLTRKSPEEEMADVNRGNIDGVPDLVADLVARGLTKPEEENDDNNNDNENDNDNAGEKRGDFSYYFKAVSEDPSSPTRVSEQEVLEAIVASGISPYQALRLQSQYGMALRNLADMAPKNSYPICQTAYCGAESGALVIDPDGKIHTCWDMVGLDGECVGYVDEGDGAFAYNFNKARWRIRCSDKMEACTTCPYVFICRGGCGSDAKRRTGSPFSEECGEFKEMFSYAASRALARRWKNMGKDELSVSLYGPLSRMTPEEREELMSATSGNRVIEIFRQLGLVTKGGSSAT